MVISKEPFLGWWSIEGRLKISWTRLITPVGTSWRCGDGLFFQVPPLASGAFLTTLYSLLENVTGVIRRVHELFKRPRICSAILKRVFLKRA
jgi:hypothetical protein